MDPIIISIGLLIVLIALIAYFGWKISNKKSGHDEQSLVLLQNQMNQMTKTLDERMNTTQQTVQNQYKASTQIIRDVTERLTKLDETNKRVVDFATQLKSLEDILKNPKQRGILGEYFLETILENTLPGPQHYQMQYKLQDDKIVDAAIFVKEKIIPVDAKFSLENWNRLAEEKNESRRTELERLFKSDLKNRVDETAGYILPEQGTVDFAIMFIPAEGIFHSIMVGAGAVSIRAQDLIEYAFKKHVVIVSPSSFYAYLQTILHALRSLQIEDGVKDIIKRVGELNKHLGVYDTHMQSMGKALGTAVNQYNIGYKEFHKIDRDVLRITGESNTIEPLLLDKPVSREGDSWSRSNNS